MNKVVFLLGLLLILGPVGIRVLEEKNQNKTIKVYEEEVNERSSFEKEEALKSAENYNAGLFEGKSVMGEYESQLNLVGTGIMGTLLIPKIDLEILIRHGTKEDVLADSAGHLTESSLPVGGKNTHCVLTGHRGVPSASLFTRLDELEVGDLFYMTVCGRILTYKVLSIVIVKPEETECLEILEGRDLVSLVTCTPYGLNTHRLVVTGERELETEEIQEKVEELSFSKWDVLPCILGGGAAGGALFLRYRRKKRGKGEDL